MQEQAPNIPTPQRLRATRAMGFLDSEPKNNLPTAASTTSLLNKNPANQVFTLNSGIEIKDREFL
jgi:hypothetical protein